MTTKQTIKGSIKTGTGAFVIVELLNLVARLVHGLLNLLCTPLWNLQKKIQNKKPETKAVIEKELTKEELKNDFRKVLNTMSAGEQLATIQALIKSKREYERIMKEEADQ